MNSPFNFFPFHHSVCTTCSHIGIVFKKQCVIRDSAQSLGLKTDSNSDSITYCMFDLEEFIYFDCPGSSLLQSDFL